MASPLPDIPDDIVLEIITRLPPKYAFQCSSLSKFFFQAISSPYFARRNIALSSSRSSSSTILMRCSYFFPKIYTRLSLENPCRRLPVKSKILIDKVYVMDSYFGVLLLRVDSSGLRHVFNPITGGIVAVDHLAVPSDHGVALVIDFLPDFSNTLKLATVHSHPSSRRTHLTFQILVPHQDYTELKSEVSFSCERLTLMKDDRNHIKPVYAHGAVHWLADDATKIIALNVEKEQARIIDGPMKKTAGRWVSFQDYKWFGLAEGSLSYVCTRPGEILVLGHDASTDEWRVQYRIDDVGALLDTKFGNGMPVFFDGRRLLVRVGRSGAADEVCEFDVGSRRWKKRGVVEEWSDGNQLFIPFFPTLAKVSDDYLQKKATHVRDYDMVKDTLLQLQRLFRV